jgi:uncharacterized protein with von Willebrand factor type A (vWA) domain
VSRDWSEHLKGDGDKSNRIPSLSKSTSVELRLADQWIGNNTTLPFEEDEASADLERDLFWSLYRRYNPFKEEVDPSRVVNQKIVKWLTEGATWESTHNMTIANRIASAASSEIMKISLLNDPEVKKMLEEQKEIEQQQEQAAAGEQKAEEQEQAGDGAGAAKSRAGAQDAKNKAQAMANELGQKADDFANSAKGKSTKAGVNNKGKEEAQNTSDAMAGWGVEDGQGEDMDIDQLQSVLKDVNSAGVAELAELVGRAKGVGMRTLSTRKIAQLVVTDAGMTQELDSIFSDELAMLAPSIPTSLRSLQMANLMDEGLLGIIKSTETKQEGDMVIAVDGSGSMHGAREYTAKALALGITQAARENGQNYKVFTFGSNDEQTDVITQDSDEVTRLKWATFLFGGGTDFDAAIMKAIKEVENMDDPTLADIVMITDGESDMSDYTKNKFRALNKATGCRLIALLVDTGYGNINSLANSTIMVNSREAIEKAATELSESLWKGGD